MRFRRHRLAPGRGHAALLAAALPLSVALAACGSGAGGSAGPSYSLNGTFDLHPGHCTSTNGSPSGSFLVVVDSANAKTVANPAGKCADPDYTPLIPGVDKGIETGTFQNNPTPTFDAHSNSLADALIEPASFLGTKFGMATSAQDVQDAPNGTPAFNPPTATVRGTALTLDLRSLNITYGGTPNTTCSNGQGYGCWNLGSKSANGTYDAKTHQFVVQWFVGEAFTELGDSMIIRFEGTFVPRHAS
jgi:hypothetical protein